MNEEQLEKVRDMVEGYRQEYEIMNPMFSEEDIFLMDWLIEQAERVHELEEFEEEYVDLNRDFTDLALENEKYRKALDGMRLHAHHPEIIKQIYDEVMEEKMSKNDEVTEIVFILDKSGSMYGIKDDAIGGFNNFLKEQKKLEGRANLTLILFDHYVETVVNGVDIHQVEELTDATYVPSGMTSLLDAIGLGIDNLNKRFNEHNEHTDSVIFVIMTDGHENSSKEYSIESIKDRIEKLQNDKGYEFVFLGANIDAIEEGGKLGVTQSANFDANTLGVDMAYTFATQSVSDYRQANRVDEKGKALEDIANEILKGLKDTDKELKNKDSRL